MFQPAIKLYRRNGQIILDIRDAIVRLVPNTATTCPTYVVSQDVKPVPTTSHHFEMAVSIHVRDHRVIMGTHGSNERVSIQHSSGGPVKDCEA